MLLLWKPHPERQLISVSVCRQKPIYGHFLPEHKQMGTALNEHQAFSSDRWSDRQRDRGNKKKGRKMDGVETDH